MAVKDSHKTPEMVRAMTGPSLIKAPLAGTEVEAAQSRTRRSSHIVRRPYEASQLYAGAPSRVQGHDSLTDEEGLAAASDSPNEMSQKSSWGHITLLLISEYVGYATLCLPWVFSKMGVVLGTTSLILNVVLYIASSRVLWQYCLRHAHVNDIVDVVANLTKEKCLGIRLFTHVTSVFFYSITIAVMAFHIVSGAEFIDTVTWAWAPSCKNIMLSILAVLPCLALSLIRSFPILSKLSLVAGVSTYVSLIFACVYLATPEVGAGTAAKLGSPIVSMGPAEDVTFVELMVSFLTISFATNGAVTIPTFVRDMRDPRDFPKALYVSSAVVLCTFGVFGGVIYSEIGTQYMSIPAMGTLHWSHKLIVFAFMVPTIVFLGALYAAVLARRAYTRIAGWICRRRSDGKLSAAGGNCLWVAVLVTVWAAAWLVAGLVPFFSGLTSIVAAIFVSTFGFIVPPYVWFSMRSAEIKENRRSRSRRLDLMLCVFWISMFVFGMCFMGAAGLYASVANLLADFRETGIGRPFSCHSGCTAASP